VTVISKHIEFGQGKPRPACRRSSPRNSTPTGTRVKVEQGRRQLPRFYQKPGAWGAQGTGGSSGHLQTRGMQLAQTWAPRARGDVRSGPAAARWNVPAAGRVNSGQERGPSRTSPARGRGRSAELLGRRGQGDAAGLADAEGPGQVHPGRHRPRAARKELGRQVVRDRPASPRTSSCPNMLVAMVRPRPRSFRSQVLKSFDAAASAQRSPGVGSTCSRSKPAWRWTAQQTPGPARQGPRRPEGRVGRRGGAEKRGTDAILAGLSRHRHRQR